MTAISSTAIGKAAAASGLRPATVKYLLDYFAENGSFLVGLLPGESSEGKLEDLHFLVMNACLASPEFALRHRGGTRGIPYPLQNLVSNPAAKRLDARLASTPWQSNLSAVNGAMIALGWIDGVPLSDLEKRFPSFYAGMLRGLCRDLAWVINGIANVLAVATDPLMADDNRPEKLRGNSALVQELFRLPRLLRRQTRRLDKGLPEEVLWMTELQDSTGSFRLRRREILAMRDSEIISPLQAMDNDLDAKRAAVFAGAQPTPLAKNNWFKQAVRDWKSSQRSKAAERHGRRAKPCKHVDVLQEYYSQRGQEFEGVFEKVLNILNIQFSKLDDGTARMAPDYMITIGNFPPIIMELKSKTGEGLVALNAATEVLSAATVHGHEGKFCVTLCHPGYDPSVPSVIVKCGKLSVVESADLAEALLRLCEKKITPEQFYRWLSTPGPALTEDLPYVA